VFKDFDSQFTFLHEEYFPQIMFGPISLSGSKTKAFCTSLELVGFMDSMEGLRPSVRYRDWIINWPVPYNKQELEAFI
jgi:hypothetical protein